MDLNYVKMRDFLEGNLERSLDEKEIRFVEWLANYEDAAFDQVMAFFEELAARKGN